MCGQGLVSGAATDECKDRENDNCADNGTNKTRPFELVVPAHRLTDERGNESACNSQDRRHDEPARFIVARHDELCDDTGNKADHDCPDNSQLRIPLEDVCTHVPMRT